MSSPAFLDELGRGKIPMAFHPKIPDFVRVQSLNARHRRLPGAEELGKGEAEAILLAKEVGADILLTDDRKARAAAVSRGRLLSERINYAA